MQKQEDVMQAATGRPPVAPPGGAYKRRPGGYSTKNPLEKNQENNNAKKALIYRRVKPGRAYEMKMEMIDDLTSATVNYNFVTLTNKLILFNNLLNSASYRKQNRIVG